MSKRTLARNRGWIEFKGLRFALPFVTRLELVETIHTFFEECGLSLLPRQTTLDVRFCQDRDPRCTVSGCKICGVMYGRRTATGLVTKYIEVYPRVRKTREEFMGTLCHELDHVAWVLEGREFDDTLPYQHRPHEIRARKVAAEWTSRFK